MSLVCMPPTPCTGCPQPRPQPPARGADASVRRMGMVVHTGGNLLVGLLTAIDRLVLAVDAAVAQRAQQLKDSRAGDQRRAAKAATTADAAAPAANAATSAAASL